MDDAFERFAPLSEEEKTVGFSAASTSNAHEEEGKLVSPIPSDAPAPPETHRALGKPSQLWTYRDGSGETLFYVCRFDPVGERKTFQPLSLWRDASGALRWLWKSVPAPRPIYGLDRLAANPGAPVVFCEGEKAADAAALIFPKSVCITSAGGCKAEATANFEPLAGRRVLIWQDADEPGEEYAGEVARILHALGCDVSLIDAVALASMAPDGGQREPEKGFDAANAVEEWRDLGALRKAALGLAKPFEARPEYVSWGSFKMDAKGLTTEGTKGRGKNTTTETIWIASAFEVIGACRDPNGRNWGKWLRWRDGDGRVHTRHVADAALQGDPSALCGGLADEGLSINRNQQRLFLTYLSGCDVEGRVTIVHRTGWHDIGGHQVFVLPTETIGPNGSERVILDASAVGPYKARGTLKD
jgi:putative DNA primase/helicase